MGGGGCCSVFETVDGGGGIADYDTFAVAFR